MVAGALTTGQVIWGHAYLLICDRLYLLIFYVNRIDEKNVEAQVDTVVVGRILTLLSTLYIPASFPFDCISSYSPYGLHVMILETASMFTDKLIRLPDN